MLKMVANACVLFGLSMGVANAETVNVYDCSRGSYCTYRTVPLIQQGCTENTPACNAAHAEIARSGKALNDYIDRTFECDKIMPKGLPIGVGYEWYNRCLAGITVGGR